MSLTLFLGLSPVAFNFAVDPFRMNGWFDLGLDREEISLKAHYPLWKMIEYPRRRDSHVVLGDSRARALQDKYWSELGFEDMYNFGYGGATIAEIYDTFRYLKDRAELETLVIGVPLRTFDLDHRRGLNRVPEAIELADDPVSYYSSWFVAKTAKANIEHVYGQDLNRLRAWVPGLIGRARAADLPAVGSWTLERLLDPETCRGCELPETSKSILRTTPGRFHGLGLHHGLWARAWPDINIDRDLPSVHAKQIQNNARNDWQHFELSSELWSMIVEIADWSKAHDVALIFVIPPTIAEMQRRIADFGLADVNHDFRVRLAQLAPVLDFDFDSPLSREIDLFKDAYHFDAATARALVGEVILQIGNQPAAMDQAMKRRQNVVCPLTDQEVTKRLSDQSVSMLEGLNCRIWRSPDA